MQNRGAHISVQPGRAGVPADESNPRVRHCYSATVILYFLKSEIKNMLKLFYVQNKKN